MPAVEKTVTINATFDKMADKTLTNVKAMAEG